MFFDLGNGHGVYMDEQRTRCGIHGLVIVANRCADCDALYQYFTTSPGMTPAEWSRYFRICDVIAQNAGYNDRNHLTATGKAGMALYMYRAADREIKRD